MRAKRVSSSRRQHRPNSMDGSIVSSMRATTLASYAHDVTWLYKSVITYTANLFLRDIRSGDGDEKLWTSYMDRERMVWQ